MSSEPVYKMLDDRVLFRKHEPSVSGGVCLPESVRHMHGAPQGEVLAVGPGRLASTGERLPMSIKPGDLILYDVSAAIKVDPSDRGDMKGLRITNEKNVLAKLEHLL